jgi:2-oxoglutarate ferredoxin oxidoreductase subunit delta
MAGTIRIDAERCKGCALCVAFCPKGLLSIDTTRSNALGFHPVALHDAAERCSGCERCAVMCPEAAIDVFRAVRA